MRDAAGNEQLHGWHDTQLSLDCSFLQAGDGELRCVPWPTQAYVSENIFSDAACTTPALYDGQSQCATFVPKVASQVTMNGCVSRLRTFMVGAKLSSTTYYSRTTAGVCTGSTLPSSAALYAITEVPSSNLVKGALVMPSPASGIGQVTVTTPDGARGFHQLRDMGGGFDCGPAGVAGDEARCRPTTVGFRADTFGDAACTQDLVLTYAGCTPKYANVVTEAGCGYASRFFTFGAKASSAYARNASTNACAATMVASMFDAYVRGAEVPMGTFVPGQVRTSAGRLAFRTFDWPGGASSPYGWRDTQLGAECNAFSLASDGSRRCIPTAYDLYTLGYYADAACTQPVVSSARAGCTAAYATDTTDACLLRNGRTRVLRVGVPHTGPLFSKSATGCVQSSVSPAWRHFTTTGELAPSAMAPLTDVLR